MDLNLISLFVEIVDSGSFSAAARKLGVTRSNISHRLRVLEEETGTQLMRRSTRSLELTQAGHTLYEYGRRMLGELIETRASIDRLGQTLHGPVRISVPTAFGRMFAGPMLLDFARAHPGITLTVTFDNRMEDLIAAEVDVALKVTPMPPLDCIARYICAISWKLFASAGYLEQHGPITSPGDLERQAFIASTHLGRKVEVAFTDKRDEANTQTLVLDPILKSQDFPFLADAVAQGMGIGLLPAYVCHSPAYRDLVPVLEGFHVGTRQDVLYALTLPNRYPSPATRAVIDHLRESITALSSSWN